MNEVDHDLVNAHHGHRLTMIVADPGLNTRMSQIYWTMCEGDKHPLLVLPKVLHDPVRHILSRSFWRINDAPREPRIITPRSMLFSKPEISQRTMLEMTDVGRLQRDLLKRLARGTTEATVRCQVSSHPEYLIDLGKALGYHCIHYRLTTNVLNELVTAIYML